MARSRPLASTPCRRRLCIPVDCSCRSDGVIPVGSRRTLASPCATASRRATCLALPSGADKEYLPITGLAPYIALAREFAMGADSPSIKENRCVLQVSGSDQTLQVAGDGPTP